MLNFNSQTGFSVSETSDIRDDVTANGISLNSHVHGGVQAGGSDTSGPKK